VIDDQSHAERYTKREAADPRDDVANLARFPCEQAPTVQHLTSGMTDEQLISYCESHCTTERALFSARQYNRMVELAGNPEAFPRVSPSHADAWASLHEPMARLCSLARERLRTAATQSASKEVCVSGNDQGRSPATVPQGYAMRHRAGGDVGFSWKKDDPMFGPEWERVLMTPENTEPKDRCDFCRISAGRIHSADCVRTGLVEAQGRTCNLPIGLPDNTPQDEWVDPKVIALMEDEARFRRSCARLSVDPTAAAYALWQDARAQTEAAETAKTVDDRTIEELRDHLRISSVFRIPTRLSPAAADILLDSLDGRAGTRAADVNFGRWWQDQVRLNGGAEIGADYRHWAWKGYLACPVTRRPHDDPAGTIEDGLRHEDFTKVSYQGFTYSFPSTMALSEAFVVLAELTDMPPTVDQELDSACSPQAFTDHINPAEARAPAPGTHEGEAK
jgi:hypothetical protein